jgi:hypothetical protein
VQQEAAIKPATGILALLGLALAAMLAAPAAGQDASRACKDQRKAIGMSAFRALYAPDGRPKDALDACRERQGVLVSTEHKNAAKACKAERGATQESKAAFAEKYGTNDKGRNAFGKCVSSKTADEVEAETQETLNAAKACKAERGATAASRAAFAETYGTNASKRNAFAQCVREKRD